MSAALQQYHRPDVVVWHHTQDNVVTMTGLSVELLGISRESVECCMCTLLMFLCAGAEEAWEGCSPSCGRGRGILAVSPTYTGPGA